MARFLVIAGAIAIALTVISAVDVAYIDGRRARGVPKAAWILIVIVLPIIGPLLWFFVGRGPKGGGRGGRRGPIAPDDDPDFLRNLKFPKPDGDSGR